MIKKLLLLLLPSLVFSQVQIGADLNGLTAGENHATALAVSADGSIIAIGAPFNDQNGTDSGAVRVYQRTSGGWVQLGTDIHGEASGDRSGGSVSLSSDGQYLAIGATYNNFHTGHTRVYQYLSGSWQQRGNDIDGQAYGDQSGWSVSLSADGTTVAIGAPYNTNNGNDSGIVRVYKLVNNTWSQIGSTIDGWFYDAFGRSVSLSADGNVVAVGSPYNSMNGAYTGRVRIFRNLGGTWTQEGADIRGVNANEVSGYSVSLSADGSTVAIGSIGNSTTVNAGAVKVFKNVGGNWTQQGATINGQSSGESSGRSVALSGDGTVLVIGANGTATGLVRIYKYSAGSWQQRGVTISGQASGDNCGMSVALSTDGNTLLAGSPNNNAGGSNAGQARAYDITQLLATSNFSTNQFLLWPNPAKTDCAITLSPDDRLQAVKVYNALGQLTLENTASRFSVAGLAKGVYWVSIQTDNGVSTQCLLVE